MEIKLNEDICINGHTYIVGKKINCVGVYVYHIFKKRKDGKYRRITDGMFCPVTPIEVIGYILRDSKKGKTTNLKKNGYTVVKLSKE